jgi:hypothetical protein
MCCDLSSSALGCGYARSDLSCAGRIDQIGSRRRGRSVGGGFDQRLWGGAKTEVFQAPWQTDVAVELLNLSHERIVA